MTPSSTIVLGATTGSVVSDTNGRRITVRRLTALDKLRLFKAAGPVLSQNQLWLGMAVLAYSITAIDDVPIPVPTNEVQIESIVSRLGDAGINAVAAVLGSEPTTHAADLVATAGN